MFEDHSVCCDHGLQLWVKPEDHTLQKKIICNAMQPPNIHTEVPLLAKSLITNKKARKKNTAWGRKMAAQLSYFYPSSVQPQPPIHWNLQLWGIQQQAKQQSLTLLFLSLSIWRPFKSLNFVYYASAAFTYSG